MIRVAAEHEERRGGLLPNGIMCTNVFDGSWCDSLAVMCCVICAQATCNKCIARWERPNEDGRPEAGPHCSPVCNTCRWEQRYETFRKDVANILRDAEFSRSVEPEDEPWLALSKAQDMKNDYENSVWVNIFDTRGGEEYGTWADQDMPFSAVVERYCKDANADAIDTIFLLDGERISPSAYVGFLCLEDDVNIEAVSLAAAGKASVKPRVTCSCSGSPQPDDITICVHVATGNWTKKVRSPPHASTQQLIRLFKESGIPCNHARLIAASTVLWLNSDGFVCDLGIEDGGTVQLVDTLLCRYS